MTLHDSQQYALLVESRQPAEVSEIIAVLRSTRIPYQSGLLPGDPPQMLFYVPRARVDEARGALRSRLGPRRTAVPQVRDRDTHDAADAFPWWALGNAMLLVLLHLALVFWMLSPLPPGRELLTAGGLVGEAVVRQPWRLLTSLVLHADPSHAMWNGVSLCVFAVPLLVELGRRRTASIYVLAGLGGGLAALAFASPGVYVVGSSGAVAGLFGAWVVLRLRTAEPSALGWRQRVRAWGIALLVLPSLLNPVTASGQSVSVSSHLGGMATGMALGVVLSVGMLARRPAATLDGTAAEPGVSALRRD